MAAILLALVAGTVTQPGTAHARCRGEGVLVESQLIMNGNVVGVERPDECNGDNIYNGIYRTARSGWAVWIETFTGSRWVAFPKTTGGVAPISYGSAAPVVFVICATDQKINRCGFGSNWVQTRIGDPVSHEFTGTNWGF